MSRPTLFREGVEPSATVARGTWLVAGLVLLGVAAAVTGIWFQRHQTRRCLAFYGPAAARRIAAAPSVELLLVQPGAAAGRLAAHRRVDVSKAPGLVHLRRGLVEDANFNWRAGGGMDGRGGTVEDAAAPLPLDAWDVAFVFTNPDRTSSAVSPGGRGSTTLVVALDSSGGSLTVVGQPGRIGLGRIGPGLEKWIRSTLAAAGEQSER